MFPWPSQGASPVRGAPGWLALNPVGGMREPPSGSMQQQKLQFQSVIYGNPEQSNWHKFSHAHLTIFSIVWVTGWFYQDHPSRRNAKTQNISIVCRVKPKSGEKKNNISKNHLSTVYLKSSEKIICAISEIQWQTKIIKCGRIVPLSRWDGPDRLPMEVRSQHDETYELFLPWRKLKSFHFWSVVGKVPWWSFEVVIIGHHA